MKKKCAIFLAATKDSMFALANVIIGINKYSKNIYDDIYIYHDGASEKDLNALNKLGNIKNILYEKYEFYKKIGFLNIDENEIPKPFERYTHLAFARYEMFNLLNEYEHVIYFDYDMLIQEDISELLKYNLGLCKGSVSINYALGKKITDFDGTKFNYSSGLIVVSDKINYYKITQECYTATKKFFETLVLPDQGVLNYVFLKLGLKPEVIPDIYYGSTSQLKSINSKIIHAHGKYNRFWNNQAVKLSYPEWTENDRLWRSLGGSPYSGKIELENIFPKDKGYLMQYLDRITLYSKIMTNIQQITKLPLYCSSCFINSDVYFYCHGIKSDKFKLKIRATKINEVEVYIYFNNININTADKNVLDDNGMKYILYKISKNNIINELKNVFDNLMSRSSLIFNEIKLI